ncbi:NCS1 family nucleobase:cation symporter-1 [Leucosporidium creatinivorum]|uniref:NCS1 family nucleobase:cation symporter-1 n=1 Tax=Leucosporidium creatinivorum TaxID=106004 RepID=A0A1Y2F4X7_9BASI|nr:NCS1 family nucleobase:cation symporter-1 [Leucosporidium creatinivorum]
METGSAPLKARSWAKRLECPIDEDADYVNDRWTNRDLIPIPPERRTYGIASFAIYWLVSGACISAYSTGSSLLAYGLTAQQSMACVVVGGVIAGLLSVACGWMGERHHIGFTCASRFSWGMRGSYFPVLIRVFTSIWWFGIQSYWGGQAVRVMLGAIIPGLAHMKNTIPLSSHIETKDLIGLLIWYAMYIPFVLIPPERLQRPFAISSAMFMATLVGLLIWSVHTTGGGGPLFHTVNTAQNTSWSIMYGITSILGSWGSGTLGQNDWTRYANRRYAPTLSQLVAAPVTITVTALLGVIITSASSSILTEQTTLLWSPITLLAAIQEHYGSSPRVRAAVFFGGLGCSVSQLSINVVLNSVSAGMDMAGLAPRWINIRRGAYILALFGIVSNPWQILATAATFLAVISGLGALLAPMTGIMLADYFVVRKQTLKMEDLYIGSADSIYWFDFGFNWRALVAWAIGTVVIFPGFIMVLIDSTNDNTWVRLFNMSFLVGVALGFVAFWAICAVFPPPNLGEGVRSQDEAMVFGHKSGLSSIQSAREGSSDDIKNAV